MTPIYTLLLAYETFLGGFFRLRYFDFDGFLWSLIDVFQPCAVILFIFQ